MCRFAIDAAGVSPLVWLQGSAYADYVDEDIDAPVRDQPLWRAPGAGSVATMTELIARKDFPVVVPARPSMACREYLPTHALARCATGIRPTITW
ncbi:MAG: hypothetical protein LAT65_19270 [Saccharospirillum sp.]|nr:hypothetical protein [Saccharospirillum sp.]